MVPPTGKKQMNKIGTNRFNLMQRGISDYELMNPEVADGLEIIEVPLVDACSEDISEFAIIIDGDPEEFEVPIVPWPVSGQRPLDPETGTCAGTTEGWFSSEWENGKLIGRNEAVAGEYVIGFAVDDHESIPNAVDLWHMNHHPDGGQLFYSSEQTPFVVPVIPVGEEPEIAKAKAIYCDGTFGICLLPGVWHEGVFPIGGNGRFFTRQGRVHGRVSVDFGREFGCLLRVSLEVFT